MGWTRQQLLTELETVIRGNTETDAEVTEATELVADLGLDSLGVMELVADVEDRFDLTIDEAELRDVASLGDVVEAIEKRLRADGRMIE